LISVESTAVDGILGGHPGDNPESRRGFLRLLSQWILGCNMHGADRLSLDLMGPAIFRENLHAAIPRACWYKPFFFCFTVIIIVGYNDNLAEDILQSCLSIFIVSTPCNDFGQCHLLHVRSSFMK
jgi:hypothetical protein